MGVVNKCIINSPNFQKIYIGSKKLATMALPWSVSTHPTCNSLKIIKYGSKVRYVVTTSYYYFSASNVRRLGLAI
jgi:hypothetical protein